MQTHFILRTPTAAEFAKQNENGLKRAAFALHSKIIDNIRLSRPSGRTYRRGAITAKFSKRKHSGLRLRTKAGTNRVITGAKFHRASAPGQPPAIDTGRLLNSIRIVRAGSNRYIIGTGVVYAAVLDNEKKLNRPFFRRVVLNFQRTEFLKFFKRTK